MMEVAVIGKYQYTICNNTVKVIGAEDSVVVYDLSSWKPEIVNYYRSLLAQKRDLEYAKAYLDQMFFQEDTSLIDGALMNSAIQLLVKCFSNPSNMGRRCLDSTKVFRKYANTIGEQDLTVQFSKFYSARNTVISHDQINFKENVVGLIVDELSGMAEDIAEVTIQTRYVYNQNQKILLRLIHVVTSYVDSQIEKLRNSLITEYNQSTEKPVLSTVTCENIPISTAW